MPARKADVVIHRLTTGARTSGPTRIRYPWNERRKRRTRTKRDDLSEEQIKALQAAREKKKDDLRQALLDAREIIWKLALDMEATFGGHKVNYYFRLIVQNVLHLKKAPRKISLWNAYVSKELKRMNDEETTPEKTVRVSSESTIKELAETWKSMSPEEQEAAAADELKKLRERQEGRRKGVHNVTLNAFNDTRATLASTVAQLEECHGRTENEFALLAVRANHDDYNPPFVFYTSDRVANFFELVSKNTIQDFVVKLEAYCISGVDGVTRNAQKETLELKHKVKELILGKLQESCTRTTIVKMFYVNFEDHITLKYGIIIKNWPIKRFLAPGKLSRVELEVLLNAFQNNSAGFIELNDEDWTSWRDSYRDGRATAFITGGASFAREEEQEQDHDHDVASTSSSPSSALQPPSPPTSLPTTSPPAPVTSPSATAAAATAVAPTVVAPTSAAAVVAPTSAAAVVAPTSAAATAAAAASTAAAAAAAAPTAAASTAAAAAPTAAAATPVPPPTAAPLSDPGPRAFCFLNASANADGTALVLPKRSRKRPTKKSSGDGEPPRKRARGSATTNENTAPTS